MTFGICNAYSMFQRLMQKAMEGINLRDCLYLDDDIISWTS